MEIFIFEHTKDQRQYVAVGMIRLRSANGNADGEIEDLSWSHKYQDRTGTLGFEFLPRSMKNLGMLKNALNGTIKIADLPERMKTFYLFCNRFAMAFARKLFHRFTGTLLDFDNLPLAMQQIMLNMNKFISEISIKSLSEGLQSFNLSESQLC
ncbi:hypothetical protein XU18_4468 [Perkinsela sp. CCAP 1560/4]|nr:hypothetical protein XU18_4468 [Perkinsela sp. CCAP 1560/4]|eukprot:KNH04258.1 hypothetical protein XU18_4468 [Perkinsela sp. CCAP 1560/4]